MPEGDLSKGGARQSAVALVLWRATARTVPFLWVIWEPFNLFSRKIEQTCHGPVNCKRRTKRPSVESLLLPGPDSGALSRKDAASRENSSPISGRYKFFSSQAVVSLLFVLFFSPNIRRITASFGLRRALHILSHIQKRNGRLPCCRSSWLACNLICMFCALLLQCTRSMGNTCDCCTCSIFPR